MNPLTKIDQLLNRITMYRLVVYGLTWLICVAMLLSLIGALSYSLSWLLISLMAVSLGCWAGNQVLSRIYMVPSGHESSIITALILFFVLKPAHTAFDVLVFVLVGLVAMASKYAVSYRNSVIFNPAAFAVFVMSTVGLASGAWWVSSKYLLVPVLIAALLIIRKTRRISLFAVFLAVSVSMLVINGVRLVDILTSFPLVFLGAIMLTEPATLPAGRSTKLLYAAFVGLLVGIRPEILGLRVGPIEALLMGNLLVAVASRKTSSMLTLVGKVQLSPSSYEFIFEPDEPIKFRPGQFAEFTIGSVPITSLRGNRRTFTISSAPSDTEIRVGVKFYDPGTVYKQELFGLQPGGRVAMNHIEGSFVIDQTKPAFCIAGGIGVTPFVSTIRAAMAADNSLPMTLVYFVSSPEECAYRELLDQAERIGVKVYYVTDPRTRLSESSVAELVPDVASTNVFISGPPSMVSSYSRLAHNLGARSVHTDYFTGY